MRKRLLKQLSAPLALPKLADWGRVERAKP